MESVSENEDQFETCTQYAFGHRGYSPVGKTRERLPAGSYDIVSSFMGTYIVPKKVLHDELIEMEDSPSQQIMADIRKFWSLKDRYDKLGFVHKRGFLLYGPPGTGKTSVTNLVATSMASTDGLTIYCQYPGVLADILKNIREVEDDRQIVVVMEDIDNIIESNGEEALLSLLDGQATVGSVVYIATTNNLESLPDRIAKRPSRFDKVIEVGTPPASVREHFLAKRGCANLSKKEMARWVKMTDGLTIAHMKELIISVLLLENDLKKEAERLRGLDLSENSSDPDDDYYG